MTDREVRRMSRKELIEIIYRYQALERSLRAENTALRRSLDERRLRLERAGSIAEAALSLNRVFESAQAAAEQYLEELRRLEEEKRAQQPPRDGQEGTACAGSCGVMSW